MNKVNRAREILQIVTDVWILLVISVFIELRIVESSLFRSLVSRLKGL